MARHNTRKRKKDVLPYYSFAGVWLLCAFILPLYRIWAMLITIVLAGGAAYFVSRRGEKDGKEETAPKKKAEAKSPGAEEELWPGGRPHP